MGELMTDNRGWRIDGDFAVHDERELITHPTYRDIAGRLCAENQDQVRTIALNRIDTITVQRMWRAIWKVRGTH